MLTLWVVLRRRLSQYLSKDTGILTTLSLVPALFGVAKASGSLDANPSSLKQVFSALIKAIAKELDFVFLGHLCATSRSLYLRLKVAGTIPSTDRLPSSKHLSRPTSRPGYS